MRGIEPSSATLNTAEGLEPLALGSFRVLHAEGEELFVSRGLDLFRSRDAGRSFEAVASAPGGLASRTLATTPLSARFLRAGFHALLPLGNGDLLAIVRGAVLHLAAGRDRFTVAHRVARGTRPLNLCVSASGRVFFGEYFPNRGHGEVHVFGSDDGRRWEIAHTFPAGSIRHVHGIHRDDHRGGMWVLTGDEGEESGLWWTDDELATLEPVVRGVQQVRAVTLFALPEGLVLPTDTPSEENSVQHLDPATGRLTHLARLPGSVLFSTRTASLLLFSTAVEKSLVNRDPRPALFASRDGLEWRPIARFHRDLRVLDDRRGYLQYPTLVLPSGSSTGTHVLASGQALAGAHGRLLSWSEAELLEAFDHSRRRPAA